MASSRRERVTVALSTPRLFAPSLAAHMLHAQRLRLGGFEVMRAHFLPREIVGLNVIDQVVEV
jgi:hypothetical protein